jgi:hypothetical protein
MRPARPAEEHGGGLAPTGETAHVALGLVILDRLLEFQARKKV